MAYTRTANEFADDLDQYAEYCDSLYEIAREKPDEFPDAVDRLEDAVTMIKAIKDIRAQLGKNSNIVMEFMSEDDVHSYHQMYREHECQKSIMNYTFRLAREEDSTNIEMVKRLFNDIHEKALRQERYDFLASRAAQGYVIREKALESSMDERN